MRIIDSLNDYRYMGNSGRTYTRAEAADLTFQSMLEQGKTAEEAQEAKNFMLNFGKTKEEIKASEKKTPSRRDLSAIREDVWQALMERYDATRISVEDKQKLVEELCEYGLITEAEKNQLIKEINKPENIIEDMRVASIDYDKRKSLTLSEYLLEDIENASIQENMALKVRLMLQNNPEYHYI